MRYRRIIREEADISQTEREEGEEGTAPLPGRPFSRASLLCLQIVGALVLGLLCGILSHAAVYLLNRALG